MTENFRRRVTRVAPAAPAFSEAWGASPRDPHDPHDERLGRMGEITEGANPGRFHSAQKLNPAMSRPHRGTLSEPLQNHLGDDFEDGLRPSGNYSPSSRNG
ncbi:hypothetical protein [Streptomyces sp. NPDC056401]|uniref:hypothetical protein n=1 Tax=Streptomyces sp. NPDC056401 TaxID=3345809 RepID=UPI0035E0A450